MSKQTTLFGFTQPCKKSAEVSKDERYDQTKRKRKFQESWRERFPWVEVDHPSGSTSSDADVGDSIFTVFTAEHFQNVQTNQVLYSRVPVISDLIHLFRMIRQANIS